MKLPGADPIFYKYDAKDRLVMSQDGNQRQRGVWSYTLYDSKNRSIEIGETTSTPPSTIGDSYDPSNKSALQYLYYDNYNYAGVQSFNTTENISGVDKYLHVTGLQTGAKTKVLGTDSWIITTTYFDNKVRPIQVIADIYGVTDGKSIVSTKYDFVGNVLQTREKHENDVVVSTNTYDTRGRLLTTSTSLNGSTPATMAYVYDELGRLSTKKYGNNIVSETYAYNVRGWLTEKNSSKFNMKLRYQNPAISGTTARYNGNITEWEWKQDANAAQAYTFTYDGISRLTDNKQYAQSGGNWTLNNSFVEQGLTYDFNGNIKSLKRYSNSSMLDNLDYSYSGNQLTTLSETVGTTTFTYDKNGNMIKDSRKNLDYQYNSLNLLSEVKQGSTSKAKYIYASDGTKLGVTDAGGNGYDYRGSLIYKRAANVLSLESGAFSDGRITKTNSTYVPNYYITDHLGSVRVIFDASGTVLEQNDYYAFGGKHFNSALTASNNRFKYNGKELQTTGNVDFLDYGARMYDTKLVRTHTQDLLQEDYYGISSYAYCFNDPVRYVDMFGMYPDDPVSSMRQNIGTVNVNGGRGDDYNWFSAWIRQLAVVRDRDIDKAKQYGLEALRLIEGTLHGFLSRQAYEDYLKEGSTSSYLKLIGLEIFGQWTSPELLVGEVSMGIGGLQVVNSPLKAGAGAVKQVAKGAEKAVASKVIHGNSLKSQKPTWGYKLYEKGTDKFLKNGITSKEIPQKRYTQDFMSDKYMKTTSFPDRRSAYEWETKQNMIHRGPLNKNMH